MASMLRHDRLREGGKYPRKRHWSPPNLTQARLGNVEEGSGRGTRSGGSGTGHIECKDCRTSDEPSSQEFGVAFSEAFILGRDV
jgi:hypothetical protein